MLTVAVWFALSASDYPPEAAFLARVYKPGKARSYFQVNVWRGPGKTPDRLTDSEINKHSLCWVGRDHLAWVEGDEPPGTGRRLVMYDVRSRRRVLVRGLAPGQHLRRGPWFDDHLTSWPQAPVYLQGEMEMRLTPSGLVREVAPNYKEEIINPELEFISEKGSATTIRWKEREARSREGVPSMFATIIEPDLKSSVQYLYSSMHSANGCESWGSVWRVDFERGIVTQVLPEVLHVQFSPRSMFWAGSTGSRDLDDIGDGKFEWIERGYVGNWVTGQKWLLLDDVSWVKDVRLRPN